MDGKRKHREEDALFDILSRAQNEVLSCIASYLSSIGMHQAADCLQNIPTLTTSTDRARHLFHESKELSNKLWTVLDDARREQMSMSTQPETTMDVRSHDEVKHDISRMISTKRARTNVSNIKEFTEVVTGKDSELAARTNASDVTHRYNHMRRSQVHNNATDAPFGDETVLPSGVRLRLEDLEKFFGMVPKSNDEEPRQGGTHEAPKAVPNLIYKRLKALEDRADQVQVAIRSYSMNPNLAEQAKRGDINDFDLTDVVQGEDRPEAAAVVRACIRQEEQPAKPSQSVQDIDARIEELEDILQKQRNVWSKPTYSSVG